MADVMEKAKKDWCNSIKTYTCIDNIGFWNPSDCFS